MKKMISILCAVSMLGALASCGIASNSESSVKEIVPVSSDESSSTAESSAVEGSIAEESAKETTSVEEETVAQSGNLVIEEQQLWEAGGVKVTATGVESGSIWGTEIKILVENESDKDIGFSVDHIIVNDYMLNSFDSVSVAAGKKVNDSITLSTSELSAAGIDSIGKIEVDFHTYDSESYETIDRSGLIDVVLMGATEIDTESDVAGTTLYDAGGYKIVGRYVDENSFWGSSILLYIENNSDQDVIVQCDDLSVNGFMMSASMSQDVFSGKKAITPITLFQSDLDENGITSIDEVEVSFIILSTDFERIAESGKVNFAAK